MYTLKLSLNLKSEDTEDGRGELQLFYSDQLSCNPVILCVESHGFRGGGGIQVLYTSDPSLHFAHSLRIHH